MSVVGIDFGDESLTVAVARRGGIDVLQNEIGKRKTRSLVSFGSVQRFIADEAISQYLSNAANSVVYIKRIIGRLFSDPEVAHEQRFIPARLVPDARGRVAVAVKHLGKDVIVTPEQIVAAFYYKIKKVCAINMDGQKISDCVIAIPHYFTDAQRRAMLDAARMLQPSDMGGLNVLRLVNDITAVAIQYGVRRTFAAGESRVVVFYDIGVASTDVAVATVTATGVKMEAMAADRTLGGRDFDELLVTKLAADIKAKYGLDVHSNTKALLRLRKECDHIKQTLSANVKVPYTIEYLMDGKDVAGAVTREELEALIEEHLKARLVAPLDRALAAAGTTAAAVHSIELLGGGTRVPYVQTLLKAHTGRDLSKTCDADESVCWGATLHCATYSPSFKVKAYDVKDVVSYPIKVEWQHDPNAAVTGELADIPMSDSIDVFPANNAIPSVKVVTIKDATLPLQLAARYSDEANKPSGDSLVARFAVTAPTDAAARAKLGETNKLKVKVKLDANGLLSVVSAQALIEVDAEVDEEIPAEEVAAAQAAADAAAQAAAANAAKSADEKPASDEAAAEGDAAAEKKPESEAEPAAAAAKPVVTAPPVATTRKVTKKVVEKVDLGVHSYFPWNLDEKTFRAAVEQELEMMHVDREVRETAERMNELEGYILSMKSRVQDSSDLKPYFAEGKAEEFYETLKKEEEWLEDEGYDEKKAVYEAKLEQLRAVTNPLVQWQTERQNVPEAVDALTEVLNKWRAWTKTTDAKYDHIEKAQRDEVAAKCDEAALWISRMKTELEAQPLNVAPALTVKMLDAKGREVSAFATPISNKPKPAPKKEEPKPAKPAAAAEEPKKAAEEEPAADSVPADGEAAKKAEDDGVNGAEPTEEDVAAEPKAAETEAEDVTAKAEESTEDASAKPMSDE